MKKLLTKKQSRRQFLRGLGRGAVLASLAAAALLARRKRQGASGESCTDRGICRSCASLGSCGLPQAYSALKLLKRR